MRTRALGMTLAGALVLAGVLAFRWADREGRFDLETVYVTGLGMADTSAVAQALQGAFGTPLHQLDTDSLVSSVTMIPGVRQASVTLIWPGSIHLSIEIEEAAVVLESPGGLVPVSLSCSALPDAWYCPDLPVIRYTHIPDSSVLASAVDFAHGFRGELRSSVVSLDSTGVLVFSDQVQILLGSERLGERWRTWSMVRPRVTGAALVDLRFGGQAVFRRSS